MRLFALIGMTLACLTTFSQESAKYRDRLADYKSGKELAELNIYLASRYDFEKHLTQPDQPSFEKFDRLNTDAELNKVIAGLRLDLPQAESEMISYIDKHHPNPVSEAATLELGSYYYNTKRYADAVYYYDKLNIDGLGELEMSEASFKKGYSLFVQSKFKEAQTELSRVKSFKNIYYYPVNYYEGMTHYFLNDYTKAAEGFRRSEEASAYKPYVPYYIAQIYFAQKEYDNLISYAELKIGQANINNKKEIRQLLGQAYYVRKDFTRALPHLEYYEANTAQLTADEFYQLAFTQYQMGKYQEAKKNFLALTNENSRMAQLANYYLADCYLKLGDQLSSRAAFKKVSLMDYDLGMKEEALFNYGKISAELGYDREAINTLVDVKENSPYYNETQNIINDILVNSGDYANSIVIMESLPKLSNKLQETYQNVTLKRAKQLYQEGNAADAEKLFVKSTQYPKDAKYNAEAQFHIAQIYSDRNDYKRSITEFNKYFKQSAKINDLPQESTQAMASYYQAYNYLKLRDYSEAEVLFKNAIVGLNGQRGSLTNQSILTRVLPDAFVRAGDCLIKNKKYKEALTYYDQAIERKQGNYVYAMYQKATLQGILGAPYEKISTLEEIRDQHRNTEYYDDALFLLGNTYQSLGTIDEASNSYLKIVNEVGIKSVFYNTSMLRLGLISYNAGDVNTSLSYYRKVINNKPTPKERNEAILGIEEIYVNDLKQGEAYIAFLDSIPGFEMSTFSRDSLSYQIAKSYYLNAEYSRAITAFTDYLNKYSAGFYVPDALYYRADCYNLQKDYSQALLDYDQIIKLGNSSYEDRSLIKGAIIAYNYSQNFDKSLIYYKQFEVKTQDPAEKYQAQLGALRSAFRLGRDQDIETYGQKVINSSFATNEEKSSAVFYVGKSQLKAGNLTSAYKSFDQVSSLVNNSQAAEARYLMAEILFTQGNMDAAEKQCNAVTQNSSQYPQFVAKSLILLSDIYVKRSDLINARAALEAVIDNFKEDTSIFNQATTKLALVEKLEKDKSRLKSKPANNLLELQNPNGGGK